MVGCLRWDWFYAIKTTKEDAFGGAGGGKFGLVAFCGENLEERTPLSVTELWSKARMKRDKKHPHNVCLNHQNTSKI